MNLKILLFILAFPVLGFGQKINFKEIKKNLNDSKSAYNHDKLVFKFKGMPKSLDSLEAMHLYYGRNFIKNKVSVIDNDFKSLAESFKSGDFEGCITKGKHLYTKDPTNLDVILILLKAYDHQKKANDFFHHLSQLRLLTNAIKSSGDGKSEKTAYVVNSVGDEYIFLNILNIGQDYTRRSTTYKNSIVDIWSKDNETIYIRIMYNDY